MISETEGTLVARYQERKTDRILNSKAWIETGYKARRSLWLLPSLFAGTDGLETTGGRR